MNCEFGHNIFTPDCDFDSAALDIFRFQHSENPIYRQYCDTLDIDASRVINIEQIPFLPISFFKTQTVVTTQFDAEVIFESSGTTGLSTSRHYVRDSSLYEQSFVSAFRVFYGEPSAYCILGLLPSYLERSNSSLVLMVERLIDLSAHPSGGFYLHDQKALSEKLMVLDAAGQKTLLIGVTFALLDFAEKYSMKLGNTIVMETGGMKGRREEMTRNEIHQLLVKGLGVKAVHSEYGMTELLSQAYSYGDGVFRCPSWMKVLVRAEDDPFAIQAANPAGIRKGALNVIDLANIYSCSFIASDDLAYLHTDGSFEVLGRLDLSDVRGCSQMVV
ncbi:MAG: acyl transferase [Chitinophagaceae bacterium]